jgi:predicted transposase YbfD/YdcC
MRAAKLPRVRLDSDGAMHKLVAALQSLPDPRTARKPLHLLTDIVAIALCAVIANCDSWEDFAAFGLERRSWFSQFLSLPHGIPSRDTFRRVFARLDPRAFQDLIVRFVESLREPDVADDGADDKHLAIDGKTLRSSFARAAGASPLHLVQAMNTSSQMVLAHVPTTITDDVKVKQGNEITAIPKLLELVDLRDAIVTIDAIGCQTAIAAKIVGLGGGYLLQLKDNHPTLCEQVVAYCEALHAQPLPRNVRSLTTSTRRTRGRVEERYYLIAPLPAVLHGKENWAGLRTIVQSITTITSKDKASGGEKTTSECRYYLSTLKPTEIERAARCTRRHWRIESAHWTLDVTFGEDDSHIRDGNAAENFATLRRVALGLIKVFQQKPRPNAKKTLPSLRLLRKKASWSESVLASIVTQRT